MIITATELKERENEYWESGEGSRLVEIYNFDVGPNVGRILSPFIDALFDLLFDEIYQTHGNGD